MGFTAFLLRERALCLSSAAVAVGALCKAAAFAATELLEPAEAPGAAAYAARARALHSQLLSWDTRCPVERPSFTQLSEEGRCAPARSQHRPPREEATPSPRAAERAPQRRFVSLPNVLEKTLPFIEAAVRDYHQTPSAALRVRDACVLGARSTRFWLCTRHAHPITCDLTRVVLPPPQPPSGRTAHQTFAQASCTS